MSKKKNLTITAILTSDLFLGLLIIAFRLALIIGALIVIAALLSGCVSTIIEPTPTDGRTAPTAASTPPLYDGSTSPEPTEIESGAVFEIPAYWNSAAPTQTPMLQRKGRSNYQ